MSRRLIVRTASALVFPSVLALFTIALRVLSEGFGFGLVFTSFVKRLGKTLTLARVAVAMDLVRGHAGILSLGRFVLFGSAAT